MGTYGRLIFLALLITIPGAAEEGMGESSRNLEQFFHQLPESLRRPVGPPKPKVTFVVPNVVRQIDNGVNQTSDSCTFSSGEAENPAVWKGLVISNLDSSEKLMSACDRVAAMGRTCDRVFLGGHAGGRYGGLSVTGLDFEIACRPNGTLVTSPEAPLFDGLIQCLKHILKPQGQLVVSSCGGYPGEATPTQKNRRECAGGQLASLLNRPVVMTNGACHTSGNCYSYCNWGNTEVLPTAVSRGPRPDGTAYPIIALPAMTLPPFEK